MIPEWIHPGVKCICIDDAWEHYGDVLFGRFPVARAEYTIIGAHMMGGECYLILAEQDIDPGYYQADSFRPVRSLDADVAMFVGLLKDASASPPRELEPV